MNVRIHKDDVYKASSPSILGSLKILGVSGDNNFVLIEVSSLEVSRLTRNGISYDRRME